MDRLYFGQPNDEDVDALLSQLNDESLMKLKLNSHNVRGTTRGGFEYPTFNSSDRWLHGGDDETSWILDAQLKNRFSNLKAPISPFKAAQELEAAKKKARDAEVAKKKARDAEVARKKARDAEVAKKVKEAKDAALARMARESQAAQATRDGAKATRDSEFPRQARDSWTARSPIDFPLAGEGHEDSEFVETFTDFGNVWQADDSEVPYKPSEGSEGPRLIDSSDDFGSGTFYADALEDFSSFSRVPTSSSRKESDSRRLVREFSSRRSERTEFHSFRADNDFEDDVDNLDANLNERFRALKSTSESPSARIKNSGLDNLVQFSEQPVPSHDDDGNGPSSTSPSANLLGRSHRRSSSQVIATVSTSCHCSTPSPLKLLKQLSSKKRLSSKSSGRPPAPRPGTVSEPTTPAARNSKKAFKLEGFGSAKGEKSGDFPTTEKKPGKDFKVEGFGNSKPVSKESEMNKEMKNTRKKGGTNGEVNNMSNSSAVKEVKRLLSSVADRVGLDRTKQSSEEEDDDGLVLRSGGDLLSFSVLEMEKEYAEASTAEDRLDRQADRVVEWARNAAFLNMDDEEENSIDMEAIGLKDDHEDDERDEQIEHSDGSSEAGRRSMFDITQQVSDGSPTQDRRSKIELSQRHVKTKKKWGMF